jgi:SAM-dependent methyltransferase
MGSNGVQLQGEISALANSLGEFKDEFDAAKTRAAAPDFPWYPYDSLGNFIWLDRLLTGAGRDLTNLVGDLPILDIGCADGATSFFLERAGFHVDVIDNPPTSFNGMRGLRALKSALDSNIGIRTVDLDSQFKLPQKRYGLILMLGLLYHLKNPFYVLETLSFRARYCLLSTRIAKVAMQDDRLLYDLPVAYLVDPHETNNDATNFWIFSKTGLERLVSRTGWKLRDYLAVGDVESSNPASPDRDERAFCLLESERNLDATGWWKTIAGTLRK